MDKEQIRKIVKEEIGNLITIDKHIFEKHLQILDGRKIVIGRSVGTEIGTAIDQLLAFYGATPVNQPDTISDPTAAGGAYSQAQVNEIVDAIKAIIDRLQELGLIA